LRQLWQFETTLPNSPLSYEGTIVKVVWCVRVRVFLDRGKEFSAEWPFQLGRVPRARKISTDGGEDTGVPQDAQTDDEHRE
jgi:hypothetical protein